MSIREFAIREGYMKVSIDAILQSAKQLKNTSSVDEPLVRLLELYMVPAGTG